LRDAGGLDRGRLVVGDFAVALVVAVGGDVDQRRDVAGLVLVVLTSTRALGSIRTAIAARRERMHADRPVAILRDQPRDVLYEDDGVGGAHVDGRVLVVVHDDARLKHDAVALRADRQQDAVLLEERDAELRDDSTLVRRGNDDARSLHDGRRHGESIGPLAGVGLGHRRT
jgi:hypothetical protein